MREEGFAAASTRRIVEHAGVSQGVIQYHFGDRDGLLLAVIDQGIANLGEALVAAINAANDINDPTDRHHTLATAIWAAFSSSDCMATLEILIAARSKRGALGASGLAGIGASLERAVDMLGGAAAGALANLMWASPVGMMIAQMTMSDPLSTIGEQQALVDLVADRLTVPRHRRTNRRRLHHFAVQNCGHLSHFAVPFVGAVSGPFRPKVVLQLIDRCR